MTPIARWSTPAVLLAGALAGCGGLHQTVLPGAEQQAAATPAGLRVEPADVAAAAQARVLYYHLMKLRRPDGTGGEVRKKYPADLTYSGGPLMKAAVAYNIYVNCKSGGESCWGDPEGFQKKLAGSTFAALLTQYTKSSPGAYTFGGTFAVTYRSFTKLFYRNDLLAVLHAALVKNGEKAGYDVVYHIFLPKGTDTCFDFSRSCYSPNHKRTNDFCAYHESVRFSDVKEVVVASVEPYQDVGFCASRASKGASALTNSTASTLAHETFESITDPGPKLAWFNFTFNSEVADLCQTFEWKIAVNGVQYSLQPMYSNRYHACADGP